MIIVSGKLYLRHGTQQQFLQSSAQAIKLARSTPSCRDFVVAADPIEPNRVNVYEEWDSVEALLAFRGSGPAEDLSAHIMQAEVSRHVVASSGPA